MSLKEGNLLCTNNISQFARFADRLIRLPHTHTFSKVLFLKSAVSADICSKVDAPDICLRLVIISTWTTGIVGLLVQQTRWCIRISTLLQKWKCLESVFLAHISNLKAFGVLSVGRISMSGADSPEGLTGERGNQAWCTFNFRFQRSQPEIWLSTPGRMT